MADYAIVQTGGKQYKVQTGETFRIESVPGDEGDEVTLGTRRSVSTLGRPVPRREGGLARGEVSAERRRHFRREEHPVRRGDLGHAHEVGAEEHALHLSDREQARREGRPGLGQRAVGEIGPGRRDYRSSDTELQAVRVWRVLTDNDWRVHGSLSGHRLRRTPALVQGALVQEALRREDRGSPPSR